MESPILSRLLQPEIQSLIAERKLSVLKEILTEWTPADIADLIVELPENEQVIVFRLLHNELAADTFEHLDFDTQELLLKAMGKEEAAAVLNEMSADDRTALFEEMPSSAARQLIQLLSHEERIIANTLLGYPENSVGRLMTPDYIAVRPDMTVQQVLDYIRNYGRDKETLNIVYIIDEKVKLIDDIKIREFLLAPLDSPVSELMNENFVALNVNDDQEAAIDLFKKYDRVALPVVDRSGILLGIVTVDDVLDVAEEEATEDIHKLSAIEALDDPYPELPVLAVIKKRVPWLSLLLIGQSLTAMAMGFFEGELLKVAALALFIPMLISSGGNSGSQAATLVVRAMALGEITLRDWWHIMRREIFSGLAMGLVLGIIGFCQVMIISQFSTVIEPYLSLIALTVGVSLVGIVLWGNIAGSMLPFILKRFGIDPAASSAPLVATLVDVTGLIIYFTVALLILSGKLL